MDQSLTLTGGLSSETLAGTTMGSSPTSRRLANRCFHVLLGQKLTIFEQQEIFTPPSDEIVAEWGVEFDPESHGESGNINVTYSPWFYPLTRMCPVLHFLMTSLCIGSGSCSDSFQVTSLMLQTSWASVSPQTKLPDNLSEATSALTTSTSPMSRGLQPARPTTTLLKQGRTCTSSPRSTSPS